jgi:hypothetical protein
MNTASVDSEQPWVNTTDVNSTSLKIVLLKKTLILHWGQFIYAEGSDDEVRIVFGTHDVIVQGAGLSALLPDISAQHVASIHEPARPDRFPGTAARFVREIEVRRIDSVA